MIKIRPFNLADSPAVVELWTRCGLVKPWNNPYLDIERKMAVGADLFLVAVDEGQLAGTIMGGYEGHRGWINYLAVDPGRQRRGLGRRLMTTIEEKLLARGCPKINLQVRRSNTAVIEFYNAIGYAEDDVISFGKRLISDEEKTG